MASLTLLALIERIMTVAIFATEQFTDVIYIGLQKHIAALFALNKLR
jgi:hypothetical protein